jgi:hypothetical protein
MRRFVEELKSRRGETEVIECRIETPQKDVIFLKL